MRGLYKFVRNPMYVGVLSVVLSEAFFFEARVLFEYAGVVFVSLFGFVGFYEEPALKNKFGASYDCYRDAVPRWILRMRRSGSTVLD